MSIYVIFVVCRWTGNNKCGRHALSRAALFCEVKSLNLSLVQKRKRCIVFTLSLFLLFISSRSYISCSLRHNVPAGHGENVLFSICLTLRLVSLCVTGLSKRVMHEADVATLPLHVVGVGTVLLVFGIFTSVFQRLLTLSNNCGPIARSRRSAESCGDSARRPCGPLWGSTRSSSA